MKNPLSRLALQFLLLLPLLGYAQPKRITGRVVDANTKDPIPFTSLALLRAGTGALANENGDFQLVAPADFEQDSLVLMALGYPRRALLVEPGNVDALRVELIPRPINVISYPVRKYAVAKGASTAKDEPITGKPGTQYAFFIENDKRKEARQMRSVSFYIAENGLPLAPFRVRFYKSDGTKQAPATDLLTERLVLVPAKSGQWFTTDLSRYHLAVPKEGYFVALEFEEPVNQSPPPSPYNYVPAGQIMRPPFDFKKSRLWSHTSGTGWQLLPQSGSSRRYNAMVKVEVDAAD